MPGHHDRALAERRKTRAVELAAQGCDYDTIAREVGYANRGTAHRTVMRALREHTADAVEDMREAELERLDALQQALWGQAMTGDPRAVQAVLRVIGQRCRLLGLEQERETQGLAQVVVSG